MLRIGRLMLNRLKISMQMQDKKRLSMRFSALLNSTSRVFYPKRGDRLKVRKSNIWKTCGQTQWFRNERSRSN